MLLLDRILLLSGSLSGAVSVVYKGAGDEVVISAGCDHSRITTITWKHNEDMAVEWYGGEPSVYRHFNGCTSLDIWTGALTILGLTRDHSGRYTAEINNRIANTTEVRVISPVPKPTVSMQCDAEMTYCTLTCESNTTDTGPVTYSWQIPDTQNYHIGQQFNISKENTESWYRCVMENPISSETSEKFSNPFSSSNQTPTIFLVLFFLFLFLIGCLVVGIFIYRRCKSKKGEEDKETDEENSPDQVQTSEEIPESGALTENSPKKEEEIEVQVLKSETPESNTQTATTTSEGQEALRSVAKMRNKSEESAEESNEDETKIPLLKRKRRISVSA